MICKICEIHRISVPFLVYENPFWVLRHSEAEKNCPGYLYLEPKLHVVAYPEFPEEVLQSLGEALKRGTDWIYSYFNPEKIYTVTISEAIPHIHFHIVPRYSPEAKGLEYLKLALSSELPETEFTRDFFQKRVNEIFADRLKK